MSNLAVCNSTICRNNLVLYTKMFPEQKSTTFDKMTELIKVFAQNNPASQFFSATETFIKSLAYIKDTKYRAEAVKYITASETAKANAYVELVKTEKQFQTYNILITKEFERNMAIIKNQKFLSLAEIDANLKIALKNCDIKHAKIIRQITIENAMFSQNIRLMNQNMKIRENVANTLMKMFEMTTIQFLNSGMNSSTLKIYKELSNFYFDKLLLIIPNNTNYLDLETYINAMWNG